MGRGSIRQRSGEAIPAGLPPVGPAGGDLSGFFPNPTVVAINGQPVGPGTVDGQIWIFDLPTASWVPSAGVVMPDNPSGVMATTFAETVTGVSYGQTQDLTGVGATWSFRAQRAAAGFVGGLLILGGGDGGTAGVNLAGDTAIELGTVVVQTTAKLSLRTANTEFGFLHAGAGAYLRIQNVAGGVANSGIFLNAANALLLTASTSVNVEAIGGQLNLLTGNRTVEWYGAGVLARTDVLHATGATSYTHALGTTSVTYGQTQHAAGAAGNPWFFRAQRGAAGFAGGDLTLGGGEPGTAAAQNAGNTRVELGTAVGQTTARLSLETATVRFGSTYAGAGAYWRFENVAGGVANSGIFLNAANALLLTASTSINVEAIGGQLNLLTGNRTVEWYGAGVLARTDVLHATGATSYTHASGTTAVTYGQTQDPSAAGATWLFQAQKGAAGFAGGTLEIGGGYGGTLGSDSSGDLNIQLGDSVAGITAKMSMRHGAAGEFAYFRKTLVGGVAYSWWNAFGGGWIISGTTEVRLYGSAADGVKHMNAANTVIKFQTNDTGFAFFAAAPQAQKTIVGSRVTGAALADLLTQMATTGLWIDGTVA